MLQHPRESLNSPRGRRGTRSESCRVKHYIAHYRSPCCCRCPLLSLIQSEKKSKVSYGGEKASAPVRKSHIIRFTRDEKKNAAMSLFFKNFTAFSWAQGGSLWWSNPAPGREKGKQGLWGTWEGRNRQIISVIFTCCCWHPITESSRIRLQRTAHVK